MQKESRFLEIIRLQKGSGLTVKEFCSNEGLPTSTFYYWHKKLQARKIKNDFIPLLVKSQESLSRGYIKNDHQKDFQTADVSNDNGLLEVVYPNGTILRIKNDLDLAHLRALIHLYD